VLVDFHAYFHGPMQALAEQLRSMLFPIPGQPHEPRPVLPATGSADSPLIEAALNSTTEPRDMDREGVEMFSRIFGAFNSALGKLWLDAEVQGQV